jgi:hypothetical protein
VTDALHFEERAVDLLSQLAQVRNELQNQAIGAERSHGEIYRLRYRRGRSGHLHCRPRFTSLARLLRSEEARIGDYEQRDDRFCKA